MSRSQYVWIFSVGIFLILVTGTLAGNVLQNVALNQNAFQSSQNGTLGAAGNAVDGKQDPRFQSGSCTLTNEESDPWWSVDLQAVYAITAITVTNRDEYENRLNGAEIWIGNSLEASDPTNARCAVINLIPSGSTFYFSCSGVEGRYVTVHLPGSMKILTLCEVEVFSIDYAYPLPNVALKGHATQSSTLSFAAAFKAIDGRRDSLYYEDSCSHTAGDETNPWWRVDLRQTYVVTSVKVTNRGDCCAERLDGAEIRIGNSLENNGNNNPRCASISQITAGKTHTYSCDGGMMEGRFVNVIIPGMTKTLTLCEVEVYAALAVEPQPNVAFNMQTQESSVYSNLGQSSNAVSQCPTGFYLDGCCTHTTSQANPWWSVDLSDVYRVSAVSIFNRQDCCPERLIGAEVLIGNSLQYNDNPRCGIILSVKDTPRFTLQCAQMEGRYVYVIIRGSARILSLCGVEVYASLAAPKVVTSRLLPPPSTPSTILIDRTMMLVGQRLCWSDALLYCRCHNWDLLSLRNQEEQTEVEQLLSSSPFPLTDYVWLGMRRYIMSDRWFWMSGESMTFTKWTQDSSPNQYSSPCGGMASGELFLWKEQACEELLNFICQSGAENSTQRVYFYSTSSTQQCNTSP